MGGVKIGLLDPSLFEFGLHEMNWWSLVDLTWNDSMDLNKLDYAIKNYCIGYCDGSKLKVRPRAKTYAVMFESKEHERFWFHIEKEFLDAIMDGLNGMTRAETRFK